MLQKIDLLSFLLILIGSIMVYGSKYIFKLLKVDFEDKRNIIFKLIGLVIAGIGFLRILEVI
ncbi:hypothetical protein Q428_11420 [Fervidicella metallireducens AeB]|uniref:Uncharacterized protein n=1 Tax=Fervidicella metallireducens AeB TaxID=1403537 RepID=A0A017RV67_9CLOT|nr:hypothetical protein [Fervidicella metallireducens]EYE87810.1 hypothetical protein Q428_11420 [Fervidicella metallireducens AeB]